MGKLDDRKMKLLCVCLLVIASTSHGREVRIPDGIVQNTNQTTHIHQTTRPSMSDNNRVQHKQPRYQTVASGLADLEEQPPPRPGRDLQLTQKIICMVVDVVADPENFDWLNPDVEERGRFGTVHKLGKMFNPRVG